MTKGFTIEDHEKRMRELLKPKPKEGERPAVLQRILDRSKAKVTRKSTEVKEV